MSFYGTTQEEAEALAKKMDRFIGEPVGHNRVITGHKVQPHDYPKDSYIQAPKTPLSWGVVRRWRYTDHNDFYEFGGEFLPLDMMRNC